MKILLLQNSVSVVRIPIYNKIADKYDFTIIYSEKDFPTEANFTYDKEEKQHFWKFQFYKNLPRLINKCGKNDVVIVPLSPNRSTLLFIRMLKRKSKVVVWGIGVPAGYNTRYDEEDPKSLKWFKKIIESADAALFYCDYPAKKYTSLGINPAKMFVADNTVPVKKIDFCSERNSILFVGTLYPQKKLFEVLEYYNKLVTEGITPPVFNIIGKGPEKERLEGYISEHNLGQYVKLIGPVYDDEILSKYFADAIICISPDQAGLSVLKSMGYGVAFVTKRDAITGGELFNVKDGENGVLVYRLEEFEKIFRDVSINKEKYIEMGRRAYEHYWSERRPEQMAQGFINAAEYAMAEDKL